MLLNIPKHSPYRITQKGEEKLSTEHIEKEAAHNSHGNNSAKDTSSTRTLTKGFIAGLEWGFVLFLCVLFLRVAINQITGLATVPLGTELGGFAIGFAGGIEKNL